MQSKMPVSKPLLFWGGFLTIAQFMSGFNNASATIFDHSNYFYIAAFYWALGWWFINDSRQNGNVWMDKYLDLGMFLYMGWIFLVPVYFFKTRGWKAIYTIGLLLIISLGSYVAGAIFSALISVL